MHKYKPAPHPEETMCACGMPYASMRHPHPYIKAPNSDLCLCDSTRLHTIHLRPSWQG